MLFTIVGVAGWVWVLLATTTAVSVLVLVSRKLGFQRWLLHHVGNFVTKRFGCEISMETADVEGWVDGSVLLSNVRIVAAGSHSDEHSGIFFHSSLPSFYHSFISFIFFFILILILI